MTANASFETERTGSILAKATQQGASSQFRQAEDKCGAMAAVNVAATAGGVHTSTISKSPILRKRFLAMAVDMRRGGEASRFRILVPWRLAVGDVWSVSAVCPRLEPAVCPRFQTSAPPSSLCSISGSSFCAMMRCLPSASRMAMTVCP